MDPDRIDYAAMLQEAMRDVVRRALDQVAEHGLPGEHHFFVGFQTDAPGVEVPRFLRDQHPQEVTIVLQNQFWDLQVTPEAFSVLLSFGSSRQRITVPFAALTAFADPSADFGLRFVDGAEVSSESEEEEAPAPRSERSGEVIRFDPSRRR